MDGIRRLAAIVAQEQPTNARYYLDGLELRILVALRVKPHVFPAFDIWEPLHVHHVPGGLQIEWSLRQSGKECPACLGAGTLTAEGANLREYEVECPECNGYPVDDEDEERVWTDIDGELIEA